ncbi:outer membrane protein [Phenylobacterium sp.]|uniref:outer membrane protein n=1 Tax=Phenylobacterium sp. TaxID=1871053 RepID=UPI0035C79B98
MKLTSLAATLLSATALAAGAAAAQPSDWYVRGDIGGTFQAEIDASPTVEADDGLIVSGGAGAHLTPNIRLEGELAYLQADGDGGGDLKTTAAFLNGYYDFNPDGVWRPYVGAGVGYGSVELDGGGVDDDDAGLAYQFKAGLARPLGQRAIGEIGYRYVSVSEVELGAGASRLDGDFSSHAVTVGLRYPLGR